MNSTKCAVSTTLAAIAVLYLLLVGLPYFRKDTSRSYSGVDPEAIAQYQDDYGQMVVSSADLPWPHHGPTFNVKIDIGPERSSRVKVEKLDGRVLLLISKDGSKEPRFQIGTMTKGADGNINYADSQQVFGLDVEEFPVGRVVSFHPGNRRVHGFPVKTLFDIPDGEYYVQVVVNVFDTFVRSDGVTVKLHADHGEGQNWRFAPGNLLSDVVKVRVHHGRPSVPLLVVNKRIPTIEKTYEDTNYVKHIKIRSELVSKFYGRDMYLGASVLLPEGFHEPENANTHYPLVLYHGHFTPTFLIPAAFRETPPDETAEDYAYTEQLYSYYLYKNWTSRSPDSPFYNNRVIVMTVQHANPWYDDSYATNSLNVGPYGDAITYELVPYVESSFRGIGKSWARVMFGGSTGGWESLAVQIFYPDEYNGCWASCPDPVDFRRYTNIDIYNQDNAYYYKSSWRKTPIPAERNAYGDLFATQEEANWLELATGGHKSRSGEQYDIWQAVYSPVGSNGYPEPIWNKETGEINRTVAEYWREHWDLSNIIVRDWKKLSKSLRGKIRVYVGTADSFYLEGAVRLFDEAVSKLEPAWNGKIVYGAFPGSGLGHEHCWSGSPNDPVTISRLTNLPRLIGEMTDQMVSNSPDGADVSSWRY
ncbi:hypothetical protein BJ742DRAFT_778694 [Cladochytrium replicatum]|nr:hypothetical protein BJ742DRAFT_778694 [Cladochytrium replicatum]